MPRGLDKVGKEMWELVCKERGEYLSKSDAAALSALCELWSLRAKVLTKANRYPHDKDARCALVAYHTAAERLLAKFGLTPADRAHIGEIPDRKSSVRRRQA
jgi:phage terminase small subunit